MGRVMIDMVYIQKLHSRLHILRHILLYWPVVYGIHDRGARPL